SSAGKVTIAAKEEILITCKGAYIKLSNGEVEIGSPKVVRVRAPLVVSDSQSYNSIDFPVFSGMICNIQFKLCNENGIPYSNKKYTAFLPNEQIINGITDKEGFTKVFLTLEPESIKIHIHHDINNWYDEE
ncbi:DUF2345 domain-containing protein, partial [Neisseria sp. P0022.S007]